MRQSTRAEMRVTLVETHNNEGKGVYRTKSGGVHRQKNQRKQVGRERGQEEKEQMTKAG